jgi:hypothetical protein
LAHTFTSPCYGREPKVRVATPIGGFKFFVDTKKNGALPLDLAYLEHLNVIIAIQ